MLRIGTRNSPLAIAQAHLVVKQLTEHHPFLNVPGSITLVYVRTTGDIMLSHQLSEIGGKGLFTKEIDEALISGVIDIAVHSMKDVQTIIPRELYLAAVLEREDPRDAFLSNRVSSLNDLPLGGVIGTSSSRRSVQVLFQRPDLKIVPLRGNVQTRLQKLVSGQIDATLMAVAGLHRLGLGNTIRSILSPTIMLPAVSQGAIGILCRSDNPYIRSLLNPLNHTPTALCVEAERAFLTILGGNCRAPIAGLAEIEKKTSKEGRIIFRGLITNHLYVIKIERCGPTSQAVYIAEEAGKILLPILEGRR